jgi:hypothetical protein
VIDGPGIGGFDNPNVLVLSAVAPVSKVAAVVVSAVLSGSAPWEPLRAEDSARYNWRLIQTPYSFTL